MQTRLLWLGGKCNESAQCDGEGAKGPFTFESGLCPYHLAQATPTLMQKKLPVQVSNAIPVSTHQPDQTVFSLDKVKTPALVIDLQGIILRGNDEASIWLQNASKNLTGLPITEAVSACTPEVLSQIAAIPPGQSLTIQLDQLKTSFFPSHYEGKPAILALFHNRDANWVADSAVRRQHENRKQWLQNQKMLGKPATGFNDTDTELLLGELAQMSLKEKSLEQFLAMAADLISRTLEIEMIYIEQVAQSFDEISILGETVWSGSNGLKSRFLPLMEDINQLVLETRSHQLIADDKIKAALGQAPVKGKTSDPVAILAVPLWFQKDILGVLGFISYKAAIKTADFEFKALSIADVLSAIVAQYRERNNDSVLNRRIMKYAEQQHQACWSVTSNGTVSYFNKPFIDAVMEKGASFGTKIAYQRQKGVKQQLGFSDWEEEYNKAFTGEKVQFEWQSVDKEGNICWWAVTLVPMDGNGLGYDEVLGIAEDITVSHLQQTALNMQKTKYVELIDAFEDVYFQADKAGVIVSMSSAIEKLTGFEPNYFLGANFGQFLAQKGQFHKELVELREGKLVSQVELNFKDKDNKDVWLICNLKPMHSEWAEWVGFEGLARDNSAIRTARWNERKSKSEATDALKIKDRFLANISHEIRTPLNGVMGMVELMEETRLTRQQSEYVDIIRNSGNALLHILNQLIDLSSAESGQIVLRPSSVHLPSLMHGLKRLYIDQARLKNIDFQVELSTAYKNIQADESRLYQLANNLISNAFKFTIQGRIKLKVSAEETSQGSQLVVEVSDTGCGLSATEQVLIQQLIESEAPEYSFQATKGGLGLLTSKMITDVMEGSMGFVSSPGVGSTFWFKIPLQKTEEQSFAPKRKEPEKTTFFDTYAPEVLLVDDNAVNLKVAYEILTKSGCKVDIATNGEEAVEKTKSGFYHVILMDIQMPVMDGVTATQQIKEVDLGYYPAIVAMTAYCLKEDKIRFVSAGMDDFIAKPISGDKILSKVKYWTEKSFSQNPEAGKERHEPLLTLITRKQTLESIFDFEALKGLLKHLGEDILLDSIQEFATETEQMITEMENALVTQDLAILKSHAHTLKGNAGTFGIKRLSNIARNLDNDLKSDKLAAIPEHVSELRQAANQFLDSYNLLHKNHEWKN